MKSPAPKAILLLSVASLLAASSPYAGAITKGGGVGADTELTNGSAWVGGSIPGPSDTATWDSTSLTGAQTVVSPVTWGAMMFTGNNSNLSLSGSTITLNNATGNVILNQSGYGATIANDVILNGGVATGLTVGSTTNQVNLNPFGAGFSLNGALTVAGGAGANDANLGITGFGTAGVNLGGVVTVDGQLYKTTTSVLTLSNVSNSIGWVYINQGTLRGGGGDSFGSGTIYVASTGTNTATIASNGTGSRIYSNALDLSGATSSDAGAITFGQTTGGTGVQKFGTVELGTGLRNINTITNTTFSGVVSGSAGGIIKSGPGQLLLENTSNTYTGDTIINEGALRFTEGALGTEGKISMNGGNLRWETGNLEDVSARIVMNDGKTATFNTLGNEIMLALGLGNSTTGSLVKIGGGTLTLGGVNTYTGSTTVSDGKLIVSGSALIGAGGSGISTALGKTFELTGTLKLASDTSKISNLGTFDLSSSTDILDLNNQFTSLTNGFQYDLFSMDGTISGTFNSITGYDDTNFLASFNNTTGVLTFTAIPEPGALSALLGGTGLLLGLRRRKQSV